MTFRSNLKAMLVITIILILGFGWFCLYASGDMLDKTRGTAAAWIMAAVLFLCCVGCVFLLYYEDAAHRALVMQSKGEIELDVQIQTDTLYKIKHIK